MARSSVRITPVPTFPLAKGSYDREDESQFRTMVEGALADLSASVERSVDGVLKFGDDGSVKLQPGIVIGEAMDLASQQFGTTGLIFTALDFDTVQWTAGTIFLQDETTTFIIDAGNTGDMLDAALRFIGLDVAISTTVLQVSTDMADFVGTGRILMGWAKRTGTGPAGRAAFVPTIGEVGFSEEQLGVDSVSNVQLQVDSVQADSIKANVIQGLHIQAATIQGLNIQANTLTGTHINGTTLSAIFADLGTVTAGLIEANVIIASESFSAANATFTGNMFITGTLQVQANIDFLNNTSLTFHDIGGTTVVLSPAANQLQCNKTFVSQGLDNFGISTHRSIFTHMGSTMGVLGAIPVVQAAAATAIVTGTPNTGDALADAIIVNNRTRITELVAALKNFGITA